MNDQVDAELERALVVRRGERRVDQGLHAMAAADVGEALEVENAIVGIGRRLAHEHASRRLDRGGQSPRMLRVFRPYSDEHAATVRPFDAQRDVLKAPPFAGALVVDRQSAVL